MPRIACGRAKSSEGWNAARFAEHGLPTQFVQHNVSRSQRGVLRGLHYQWPHNVQGKLVSVLDAVSAKLTTEDLLALNDAVAAAEQQLIDFIGRYVPKNSAPMCGNTIGQDRRFLVKYMPKLEAFFHYRNLDVSTVKELARRWYPDLLKRFTKKSSHLAMDDIHDSIEELRYYRQYFFKLPGFSED